MEHSPLKQRFDEVLNSKDEPPLFIEDGSESKPDGNKEEVKQLGRQVNYHKMANPTYRTAYINSRIEDDITKELNLDQIVKEETDRIKLKPGMLKSA